jgi:uncharacterized membrane protein YfcA
MWVNHTYVHAGALGGSVGFVLGLLGGGGSILALPIFLNIFQEVCIYTCLHVVRVYVSVCACLHIAIHLVRLSLLTSASLPPPLPSLTHSRALPPACLNSHRRVVTGRGNR